MKKFLLSLTVSICPFIGAYADNFAVETTDRLRVWAEFPDVIDADGESVFYIKVFEHDDDDLDYTAFNMEFILPMGFKINQVKDGRRLVDDIYLTERADATHSISCALKDGYDLRIIATSSKNYNFFPDDEEGNPLDELFTVGLIAEPTLASGKYTVTMEGIKFCLSNADARIPAQAPVEYTITVSNPNATGIDAVESPDATEEECYDLQGRRVTRATAPGLYIVNGVKVIK